MAKIYITGHKNPDMDSIAASYTYSLLKNKIDPQNEYIPCSLGAMNKLSKSLFDSLGLKSLTILRDTYSRVKEVVKKPSLILEPEDPIYELVNMYNITNPSVVPILKDGVYKGLLSIDDINRYFLTENTGLRPLYDLSIENIKRVLRGFVISRGEDNRFRAPIMVGAMRFEVFKKRLASCEEKPLLVVGCRKDHIQEAIKAKLPAIIITGLQEDGLNNIDFSSYKGFVYASHEDTAETIRLLRLSVRVETLLKKESEGFISDDTLFEVAKSILIESDKRGLPVVSKDDNHFEGFITRRCFLNRPRTKIILVDHNEARQSVIGLEDAEIVEIVDHHRLDAPKTANPITINSMPVGSTCTIIFEQYQRYRVDIDPLCARVMLAGIASDTVMLKSPTTTSFDRFAVEKLCECANTSFDEFCKELFKESSSLSKHDAYSAITSDLKIYNEKNCKVGIGQVEVTTLDDVKDVKNTYLDALKAYKEREKLDWIMLLVTNVLNEESVLILTDYKLSYKLLYQKIEDNLYSLPGILSRKKQLLPEIIRVLEP